MENCIQIIYFCSKHFTYRLFAQANTKDWLRWCISSDDSFEKPSLIGNTGTRRQHYLVETLHVVNIELVVSPNSNLHIITTLLFEILRKVVCE